MMSRKTLTKLGVLAVVAIAIIIGFTQFRDAFSFERLATQETQLRELQNSNPLLVYGAAMLIYVAVTGLSLPGATVLTLVFAWYFGFWRALVLVSFASTAGATLAFLLSRYLVRDLIQSKFGDRLVAFNQNLEKEGAFYLFTLRLIPAVPFFVINVVMGLTPMKTWTFWWVSQVGMLAGTAVYVYAGSSVPNVKALAEQGAAGILTPQVDCGVCTAGLVSHRRQENHESVQTTQEHLMSTLVQLQPLDEHNQKLQSNVHPTDWSNPVPQADYQLVVIGAGTAGLVTAAGAAGLGARVALIERELMGGDCLNVGCVPSKGVISAARVAATVRDARRFGVQVPAGSQVDFGQVMERMRRLRADISPADSAQRFTGLGVDLFLGQGAFVDDRTIEVTRVDGSKSVLKFKKAVIATGARAAAPPIPGLDRVKYLTNESLFSLTDLPARFGIVGAGPIGAEMAQTFARFGSEVFLFEMSDHILSREDSDAAAIVQQQFERDGVNLFTGSQDLKLEPAAHNTIRVTGNRGEQSFEVEVDQLLVAVGRAPNTDGLNLEAVNVKFDRNGVEVNDHLQTTNPRIYAAGDICSKFKFTHAADFQARIVIQNALFAIGPLGKKKASDLIIPWATYTSPEIAHVGMYPADANKAGLEIDTYIQHFADVDRAILDGQPEGFVKVHVKQGTDKIIGATIVAEHAGDMISELTLAMKNNVGLGQISSTIHPYPTQADAIRKLGDQFNKTRLTPTSKKILGLLMTLNVGR